MGSALSAGVSGLKAHQIMLDVAGNNLANLNTIGYKQSNVMFSELLSQTMKKASGPSGNLGGINPQQMGSGVGVAGISRNMSQGNIVSTGQDLDVAVDGEGYFVLSDGEKDVYTRMGRFAVDASNTLVDPTTGYKAQRIGTYGESDGFQIANDSSIHIPWDASMPARATTEVVLNGNLRSTGPTTDATVHKLTGNVPYTINNGATAATSTTYIADLDQWGTTPLAAGQTGTMLISGIKEDGTTFTNQAVTFTMGTAGASDGDTMAAILNQISAMFDNSSATMGPEGKITLVGNQAGYSLAQITSATYVPVGTDSLNMPTFFELTTAGGNDSKSFNITVYDSMGTQHILNGVFVKTNTAANTWDLVIPSITGELEHNWSSYDLTSDSFNRRISGIQFNTNGSYNGLSSSTETATIGVQFLTNPSVTQNIAFDLGTVGEFTGLTQFSSERSNAAALTQDGYEAGMLSGISIDNTGMVVGTFTNGIKVNVAALKIGVFQNPGGLESVGGGYFLPTANSGEALETTASTGGAGTITGKSLESSNVDVATEFVNMMQAQNGYQANARTIRVANDILKELTNLIR